MTAMQVRLTPQRRAVLAVLACSDDHPTAGDVLERVRATLPGVGPATIYRTLSMLVLSGEVAELRLGEGQAVRYDRTVLRHDHLVCTRCGRVQDEHVPLDRAALDRLAVDASFTVDSYDLQIHGRCAQCSAEHD